MRGASRRFFTNRSTTTSMLQGVRRAGHHSSDCLRQRPSVGGYASQFALRAHPTRRLWRGRITRRTSYRRFTCDYIRSSSLRRGATEPLEHTRLQSSRRMRRERSERSVRTQITSFSRLLPNQAIHHCSPTQGDAASPLRQARRPQSPNDIRCSRFSLSDRFLRCMLITTPHFPLCVVATAPG